MEDPLLYRPLEALRPHLNFLTNVGYWKIVMKSNAHTYLPTKRLYMIVVWSFVLLYNLQHVVKIIQSRHSTDQMVDTLFLQLTNFNTLSKHLTFNVRTRRLERIIDIIEGPLLTPKNSDHVRIIKQNERHITRIQFFFVRWAAIASAMFAADAISNKVIENNVHANAYFPFDINKNIGFGVSLVYLTAMQTFIAYATVIMDIVIAALYTQASSQILILRYNLENLVNPEVEITGTDGESKNVFKGFHKDSPLVHKRFIHCLRMYQQILWLVNETESVFNESMTIQFLVLAWVICMTVYKAVGVNIFTSEFLTMFLYLVCVLTQLFIYCYFGSKLNVESEFIGQSIYFCDWVHLSPTFRKKLMILTECTLKPFLPCAAKIVPISLETFIAVLRASYTLFTLLNEQ